MDVIMYKGRQLPESLCALIQRLSIRNVGLYDGARHFFLTPKLDPTEAAIQQIRREYESFEWLDCSDFDEVLNLVLNQTTVRPLELFPQTVSVGGENGLAKLQHIIFREESEAETHLIYLGNREFYVLSTNRGTILPGDILYANTLPFNVGEQEEFTITRDNQQFVPDSIRYEGFHAHRDYEVSFRFSKTAAIILSMSPALYNIIDEDDRFGGIISRVDSGGKAKFMALVQRVKDNVASLNSGETLPDRDVYPGYEELLTFAKSQGVGSYLLNLLISTVEKRVEYQYAFVENDWHITMSPEMIKRQEEIELSRKSARYAELEKILKTELAKIKTRRVGLFFKAPGRVENIEFVSGIISEIESLTKDGFGITGAAKARLDEAIDNSRPAPRENLITGIKLAAVLITMLLGAFIWVKTIDGVEKYDLSAASATELLVQKDYQGAREAYAAAYNEYAPRITVLAISLKHKRFMKNLESQIDEDVAQGLEQIKIFCKANRGRFDKTSEELLIQLLQLRPENPELLELREAWMKQ